MSAKGNLKQADASGTGKHAARHMRIDARRKPSVGPGAGRLSRRADQGTRRGRDNPSVRLGTAGQPEAPGPREKRDYRWQWRRGSPVSIPNTEVKPFSADGTWRVTARKSRSLPVLHKRHSLPVRECFFIDLAKRVEPLSARGMLAMKTYICNDVHLWYDEVIIGEG